MSASTKQAGKRVTFDILSDDQAEAMLVALSRYYEQPVMPITRYCAALEAWSQAMADRACRLTEELYPGIYDSVRQPFSHEAEMRSIAAWRVHIAVKRVDRSDDLPRSPRDAQLLELRRQEHVLGQIRFVFTQIRKSNLLHRLLYQGQKLRTRMCPCTTVSGADAPRKRYLADVRAAQERT